MKHSILILLFFSAMLLGNYRISNFSNGNSYPQPATSYLTPSSGAWLTPVTKIANKACLRRRFSESEYRLYSGKFTDFASNTKGNLQKFIRPHSITAQQFSQLKFYDRERINSHGDISECYFHGDTLFIVGFVRVSYSINGQWQQLSAMLSNQTKTTGDVALQTNPSGAAIYLDGVNQNVVTPNYLTNLRPGVHQVRFIHPDFASYDTTITVISGDILQVNSRLNTRYGAVEFTGSPRGATIRLEGQAVGKLPCTVENLVPGAYTFTVDSPFYKRRRVSASVRSSSIDQVSVMLSKAYSVIDLPQVPINVPWQINGETVASGQLRFNPGTHRISWAGGAQYKAIDTILSVSLGDTVKLAVRFNTQTGGVKVLPLPMSCSLYVDGKFHGEAPLVVNDLSVGVHNIELRRSGFQPYHQRVTIKADRVSQVHCKLTPRTVPKKVKRSERFVITPPKARPSKEVQSKGELSFVSFPPCAEVYSGDSLVAITGKGSVQIPVGRYQFRFVNGNESTLRTVTVASGERKAVLVNFSDEF